MGTTKFTSTLIAVSDMEKSKQFYRDVLGMNVVADFGANITLDGVLVLQTMDTWTSFIRTDNVVLPNNAGELYFEEEDLDAFCEHLKRFDICYVHPLFEHRWGQRVVRFYDPDKHIIEVGEKLDAVVVWALDQPDVIRVEAETAPDNLASQRVLEKCGFLPSGTIGEEGPRFFRNACEQKNVRN